MLRWVCLILLVNLLVFPSRQDGHAQNIAWVDSATMQAIAPSADPVPPSALLPNKAATVQRPVEAIATQIEGPSGPVTSRAAPRYSWATPQAPPSFWISSLT